MTALTDGVFNVDKATGMTSMDVVRQIKRLCSQRHVGHGGTLDPDATGVLPICLGQATRLMQYLVDGDKDYLATFRLGVATDTYDAQGQITDERDPSNVTLEGLEAALDKFRGTIQQRPPMYSALKRQGQRLYQLARAGVEVERESRTVEVMRLDLVQWEPPSATLSIRCSRGMYVRSLAHDVGQDLGCGAHLSQLRRLRTGPFNIEQAVSLNQTKSALEDGSWADLLYPPDFIAVNLNAVAVNEAEERQIRNGQPARLTPRTHFAQHMQSCRGYNADGRFVAMVRFNKPLRLWQPVKVFQIKAPSPYATENLLG
jgi:tRNA pseudouridine55 synthase